MYQDESAARRGNVEAAHRRCDSLELAHERFGGKKSDSQSFAALRPSARYAFIDKVQFWSRTPLTASDLATLQSQCGGRVFARDERARFDGTYVQRVQLNQPNLETIQWINSSDALRVNYAEIALDLVFNSQEELEAANDLIARLHWKHHHGKQEIRIVNGETRYSAPRSAPNVFVSYADKACRITGEIFCLHLEWRMRGRALRKMTLAEILEQGPCAFWQSRLLFREIDLKRLGHLLLNLEEGSLRHESRPAIVHGKFTYDEEARAGGMLLHSLGRSTQAVFDGFKFARPNQISKAVSASHLLPSDNESWDPGPHHSYDICRPST